MNTNGALRSVLSAMILLAACHYRLCAQVVSAEDSLATGLTRSANTTTISGYGQAKLQYDFRYRTATASLTRNVLFVGHRFSNKISFFSEMEIENAKVEGGIPSGEISMEQLFLKFDLTRDLYLQAGLFIPRIGIMNENHLPTTFNGNDRPYVEQLVIPAVWRELGIGLYGNIRSVPGLNYTLSLVNGLNSGNFENGSGIVEGRQEGSNATTSNLAATGSLLYYLHNWRLQASAYYGGTAGLTRRVADSLQLTSGPFGTPVMLGETDAQYDNRRFSARLLGVVVRIPDAFAINRAYANNTPSMMAGGYAEIAWDFLEANHAENSRHLTVFIRQEWMDLNQQVPSNGITNGINHKTYSVVGLSYQPTAGVIVKADFALRKTGARNPDLLVNPFPQALPYYRSNGFFNLGFGYSF